MGTGLHLSGMSEKLQLMGRQRTQSGLWQMWWRRRFDSRHVAAVSNEEVSTVMESTELPPALQDILTPTSTSAPTITTTDGSSMKRSTNGNNFGPGAYRK